jgi:hypothetical protein
VDAKLVMTARLDDASHLGGELQAHRWDEERRRDAVLVEQLHDTTQPLSRPVLSHRKRSGVGIAESQRDRLVVDVEREQHGDARTIRPGCRQQVFAGAHAIYHGRHTVDRPLPAGLRVRLRNRLGLRQDDGWKQHEEESGLHGYPA